MPSPSSSRSVVVSIFKNTANPQVAALRTGTWETFAETFRTPLPAATSKAELPLWAPVDFGPGGHRNLANVTAVHALTLDVDEAPIPWAEDLKQALFGLRAVCYSSPSATAKAPRWRAVIALSRPVNADEYSRLWAYVTPMLSFKVGQASKDPSRQWYAACEGVDGSYDFISMQGEALDVDAILGLSPEVPQLVHPNNDSPADVSGAEREYHRKLYAKYLQEAPARGPALRGQGDSILFTVVQRGAYDLALPTEDVLELVRKHYDPRCSPMWGEELEERVRHKARQAKTLSKRARLEPVPEDLLQSLNNLKSPKNAESLNKEIVPEGSFSFVTAIDLSKPLPPVTYIVKHFGISPGRPSLLAGYGGLGKTVVAQLLALHMAGGKENCWGLPIATGPVKHFDYEMTQDPLQRRYQRLAIGHGIELAECQLELSSMPTIYLSDDAAESALCRATEGTLFAILDNLAAATASSLTKENESGIRKYLDRLTRVTSKTGCTFWVLAHERKASKEEGGSGLQRVRGSSAITDACGSVVSINVAAGTGVLSLSHNKSSRKKGDDLHLKIVDCCFELASGVPEEDSPGLRVERLDTKLKDESVEIERRVTLQATMTRMKADVVKQLQLPNCAGGFPKTDLMNLITGTNELKRTALSELKRDGVTVEFDSSRKCMVMLNPGSR